MSLQQKAGRLLAVLASPSKLLTTLRKSALITKRITGALLVYITISGLYTFTAFILEESLQCVTWASWGIERTTNYAALKEAHDVMDSTNRTLDTLNTALGWVNPLAKLSYAAYHDATEVYLQSMRLKLLVNAPEMLEGRTFAFTFSPTSSTEKGGIYYATNGKITVKSREQLPFKATPIRGRIASDNNRYVIDTTANLEEPPN